MVVLMALTLAYAAGAGVATASTCAEASAATSPDSAVTPPPSPGSSPSAAELDLVRQRVGTHTVRAQVGALAYDFRGARFDSIGMYFDPRRSSDATPLSSPVAWDRIQRIDVLKPCGTRGAVIGGAIGSALCVSLLMLIAATNDDPGPGALGILALPPIGIGAGGLVGLMIQRKEPAWDRATPLPQFAPGPGAGAAEPAIALAVPAAESLASAPPLGVLRAQVGERRVRLWLGMGQCELARASLEPAGVAFVPGDMQRYRPHAQPADSAERDPAPASPIPWERIDRLDSWRTSEKRGAAWGAAGLTLALTLQSMARDLSPGSTAAAAAWGLGLGGLAGAGVGHFIHHWQREWSRPGSD